MLQTSNQIIQTSPTNTDIKLAGFIGQKKLISDLEKRIDFAKSNKKALAHLILSASPEMGKSTLANAIAAELGVKAVSILAEKVKLPGDLVQILTNLSPGDVVVIDDISGFNKGFNKTIAGLFYQVVESGLFDMTIGRGPSARTIQLELPPFTIIVTTSKPWQIDEKVRRWFVVYDFVSYSLEDIRNILIRLANRQGYEIDPSAADQLTNLCNGSPGNADVLVKRIGHYIQDISPRLKIGVEHISKILTHLGYGENYPLSLSIADKFSRMSGLDFEKWVAEHFRKQGYKVEMTKTTGDHGVDLLLYKGNELAAAVQCKCWDASVGEPTVRDFYGSLVNSKASEGYIFATTSFTQQAVDFAQDKPIKLIDLEALIKLS